MVEIDPSFFDDDDAVSQITFVTHQPEPPSVSNQFYHTVEEKLESRSLAEYVFRSVDKLANATEEFAQKLFSGPKISHPSQPVHCVHLQKQKEEEKRK